MLTNAVLCALACFVCRANHYRFHYYNIPHKRGLVKRQCGTPRGDGAKSAVVQVYPHGWVYLPHVECECLTLVVGVNLLLYPILLNGERVERATEVVIVVDVGDCPNLTIEV